MPWSTVEDASFNDLRKRIVQITDFAERSPRKGLRLTITRISRLGCHPNYMIRFNGDHLVTLAQTAPRSLFSWWMTPVSIPYRGRHAILQRWAGAETLCMTQLSTEGEGIDGVQNRTYIADFIRKERSSGLTTVGFTGLARIRHSSMAESSRPRMAIVHVLSTFFCDILRDFFRPSISF